MALRCLGRSSKGTSSAKVRWDSCSTDTYEVAGSTSSKVGQADQAKDGSCRIMHLHTNAPSALWLCGTNDFNDYIRSNSKTLYKFWLF